MMKLVEKHFMLVICATLSLICAIGGIGIAFIGAYKDNMDILNVGVHFAVWPSVLVIVGVGVYKASDYM